MRDYRRELRDMKSRVGERPYLFEQVTQVIDRKEEENIFFKVISHWCWVTFFKMFCRQSSAKAHVAQTYRNKLNKAGLEEQFVEEKGEAAEETTS